jgi:hypothetical protein
MNRNYRGEDDTRRNEGRWEPRMNRFGGERDWNERAFGEDFNERRDFEEGGRYGQEDRFGGRRYGMERDRYGMEDRFGGERDYGRGMGGWGERSMGGQYGQSGQYGMYGGERGSGGFGFGGGRGYGSEWGQGRGYGGGEWGQGRGYGGEWGGERGMYRGERGMFRGEGPGIMDRVRRFFGKGPKGYQRSDERIKEDLCERLSMHEWLDTSEVEVQVHNGEVTLTGTVEERQAKRLVEDIAEDVFGVKDVHNQIRVDGHREMQQQSQQRTGTTSQQTRTPKA